VAATAEQIEVLVRHHNHVEYKLAKRAIVFLLPLFGTVGAGLLGTLGLDVIDPFSWFMGVIVSIGIGFWGTRRLRKAKKVHAVEKQEAIERLRAEAKK
jgi:hypothetical protein